MIRKLLVANRGEIAIRAFRAANELGIASVAIFAFEDRYSLHRQKADESYEIGERGHPVRAYLSVEEIIRVAQLASADAIYPGYGFLSEDPRLAAACAEHGLVFVGPSAEVLELVGNKVRALDAARRAGLPTLREAAEPNNDHEALAARANEVGFPLFVKAAAGGGGRGLRLVEREADLGEAIRIASREAESSFGDETVFLEQAVVRPRHIEVQVLADGEGNVVHLFERDCSIQRRHQKVIEIAPAPHLDPNLRDQLCASAVDFARFVGYRNAGTVEFLVDGEGRYVFIEMNPRIQVEHTVTEEVTSLDLVQSQLRIASGETLSELGIDQGSITVSGTALQCRITTENPAEDFRPDTGRITTYRAPGGAGVRLDDGTYVGAEILPYFDSLLVKQTCRGRTFADAVARTRRALAEFRVRGVATNLAFLQALMAEPDLVAGALTTAFLADHPGLADTRSGLDRGTRMLTYVADVTVNHPNGPAPQSPEPTTKLPLLSSGDAPAGTRQALAALGPRAFATALRNQTALAVTDTTLRDAHQSLLATRLRTYDMVAVAPWLAKGLPGMFSFEAWGGATYDVALRFLKEDPWERLDALRAAVPNVCLQMLLRGRNTVGYTPYPDRVATAFVHEASRSGIDIFRIFDAFNNVDQMRPAIEAVLETDKVAEGTLCYSGDLADPREQLYTLDYYLRVAEQLVETGCHVLCVKDMAGLLRAPAASQLIAALRSRFDLPVHLHTHDTSGGQLATYLAAVEAGVDALDGAAGPLSGTTSQPPLSAIVAATDHTPRATGLSLDVLNDLEPYWAAVRELYAPFESGLPTPTGRVYRHEIPGGQLSNLRTQAVALGLGDRFEMVEDLYAAADRLLGRIVKVTPSSKVVGDLALYLCGIDADPEAFEKDPAAYDIPDSVIGFLEGELGTPPAGWPEPFRTKALAGRAVSTRETLLSDADEEALATREEVRPTLNRLLFPGPTKEFEEAVGAYGDLSVVPTRAFFYGLEPGEEVDVSLALGVSIFLSVDAVGEADDAGCRTVFGRLNGQQRTVTVRDRSASDKTVHREKATLGDLSQIAAPFSGVVSVQVRVGDHVTAGQTVAIIEAMKMEASITAPLPGVVDRVVVEPMGRVEGGDLLLSVAS
ncbi:MAG: pyruvate carboxylase [Acidimicrobiales bacterium]